MNCVKNRVALFAVGAALAAGASRHASASDNWPTWRGPQGVGVVAEAPAPVEFSADSGLAWTIDLPGMGTSTPVTWGDSIVLTAGVDGQDTVLCYGLDGQERWRKQLGAERAAKNRDASGANPSPATDGKYIAVYFKSGDLAVLDLAGKLIWQKNLQEEYGQDTLWWDLGTSPVLADDKVVVAVMQDGQSYLVAYQAATGEQAWKTDRTYQRPKESDQAYTTPQPIQAGERTLLVTWGADHLTAHDVATGKLVWDCGGFNPNNQGMWRVIASASAADGIAIVPYGRGNFLAGVKLEGQGDVTETNRVWESEGFGADVPTPAVADGKAYVLGDQGKLKCLALASGEEQWSVDLPRSRHKFFSSPVLVGDTLYCTRIDGTVFVGRVKDSGYESLAENALDDRIVATPVPTSAGILFRGNERLILAAGKAEGE